MKLNLGCCDNLLTGFINVDLVVPLPEAVREQVGFDSPETVQQVDLRDLWPWPDSSVDYIVAHDIIEHLPSPIHTMNEAWRVLRHGALFDISVPTTPGHGAWADPTHCSFWNRNSFYYFDYAHAFRIRFGRPYGILARFRVLSEHEYTLPGNETRLDIVLAAVKD